MSASDLELLETWHGGEQGAGEELFERYYPALMRFFANKITGDPSDLIQDTFMACLAGRERLRDAANFRSFLFGIAYNKLKKFYERGRIDGQRLDYGAATAADVAPGAGTMMAKEAEQQLLLDALRRIPIDHQVVLEMFYWEGMTSAGIADALQQPHGTIRTRIRRARQLLEEALQAGGGDPGAVKRTVGDLDGWAQKLREQHVAAPA